jgi:hypothetical protein
MSMWGTAFAQPVSVPGCKLQMVPCGNGQVLCHVFANQATDMPDPRPLNDSTIPDQGPLAAKEWARRCYQLYVVKILNNDASRAAVDPLAAIYADLGSATTNTIPSVFSTIFYNPTNQPAQAAVVYVGAVGPLPDANQSTDQFPSTQYVTDNSDAIFQSLAEAGLEKIVVSVPAGGMAMKVYTPRSILNPGPGFYGAATLSLDQQGKVFLDRRLVLLFGAFRRVQ